MPQQPTPPDEQKPTKTLCLSPSCQGSPQFKGLCARCYKSAKNLVSIGRTTWEELANMGLANDDSRSPLVDAFVTRKASK